MTLEGLKVVFRHHKNVGKTRLRYFIDEACATGQIQMYDRPCTPFKDILKSEHVTECTILNDAGIVQARGYAFCRGDLFLREFGRWASESRARSLCGLPELPTCPIVERREAAKRAAEIRHAENRRRGLERQAELHRAREQAQNEALNEGSN